MSISDINNEAFSISDLAYILKADESDINEMMVRLFSSSFCIQDNQKYVCQSLIKKFVNKKIADDFSQEILDKISKKYYVWSNKRIEIESYETSLFNRAKAYTFERKSAFLKIRDLKQKYDAGFEYSLIKNEISKLINEIPDYAYLYFSRAKLEQDADEDFNIIKNDYDLAIKYDAANDYYLNEYAYYLSLVHKYEQAIPLFEQAVVLNDRPNYHFGLAVAYIKFYNEKPELYSEAEKILNHFNKSYFDEERRVNLFRNARTADAHARYLKKIKRLKEALDVCEKGLRWSPNDQRLTSLRGTILKEIDPNYISDTMIKNIKSGIFAGVSDEIAIKLLKMIEDNN